MTFQLLFDDVKGLSLRSIRQKQKYLVNLLNFGKIYFQTTFSKILLFPKEFYGLF